MLTSHTGDSGRALLQTVDWLSQVFGLSPGVGSSGSGRACLGFGACTMAVGASGAGLGAGTCTGGVGAGRLRRNFNRG